MLGQSSWLRQPGPPLGLQFQLRLCGQFGMATTSSSASTIKGMVSRPITTLRNSPLATPPAPTIGTLPHRSCRRGTRTATSMVKHCITFLLRQTTASHERFRTSGAHGSVLPPLPAPHRPTPPNGQSGCNRRVCTRRTPARDSDGLRAPYRRSSDAGRRPDETTERGPGNQEAKDAHRPDPPDLPASLGPLAAAPLRPKTLWRGRAECAAAAAR